MKYVPWFLRWIVYIAIFVWRGPSYFCWHLGCWQPVWDHCRATAAKGNGRMCRDHCEDTSYHGKRTGCGESAPARVIDITPGRRA